LKGERTGSITELARLSVTLFSLLCFNSAFSQIPVKGFCNLKSFPSFPEYTQLTTADVNSDSYLDIILYSPNHNSIVVAEGKKTYDFTDYKIINVPYYISKIIPIYDRKNDLVNYVFTSRKNRTAGIFTISGPGIFNLAAEIEFDSFPENISRADINSGGNYEYLISGSGFKGLSVLSYKDGNLDEAKINTNQSYGEAVFADVSNDGYPDISAFNLFSNSIDIFYNDGTGNFELIRQITPDVNIDNFQAIDVDNDEYIDFIYSAGNSLNILFGDFRSALDSSLIINTQYIPHRFVVGDFNSDFFSDIAYIDTTYGLVSVIFGNYGNQYYDEIHYLIKKGYVDLTILSSNSFDGLALLNHNGIISTISKLSSLPNDLDIIPAIEVSVISSFDHGNDGVPDISYIDNFSNSINILINNPKGIPLSFYSEIISGKHNNIKVNDTDRYRKVFYAYSPGNKMLEVIKFDFRINEVESFQFYAPGAIVDMEVYNSKTFERFYIAYERNNYLRFAEYNFQDSKYVLKEYTTVDSNVVAAKIISSKVPALNYWKNIGDSLQLIEVKMKSKEINYTQLGTVGIRPGYTINFLTRFLIRKKNPISFTLFNSDTKFFGIVSNKSLFNISTPVGDQYDFTNDQNRVLYYKGQDQPANQNAFIYIWRERSFIKMEIEKFGKKLNLTRLYNTDQVTDFIVQDFRDDNTYLIYTQQSEGFLSLKRLK